MKSAPSNSMYWRVERSLINLSAVHPVAFFTWNSQRFTERWFRRGALMLSALIRPLLYATDSRFATRLLHMLLRGISRDRMELLGQEYFRYVMRPALKQSLVREIRRRVKAGQSVVLVSSSLDHVIRPLAAYLGVQHFIANRLDYRDGVATGRLLDPVMRPRGPAAQVLDLGPRGAMRFARLLREQGYTEHPAVIKSAIEPTVRKPDPDNRPIVLFHDQQPLERLSVRESLSGKHVLLLGGSGFIGKVWLAHVLQEVPGIRKISLIIRGGRTTKAKARFEKMLSQSPVFDRLGDVHGDDLEAFLSSKLEVFQGDICKPDLGLTADDAARIKKDCDVIVNSSGLTDFNPDLQTAVHVNITGTVIVLDFLRACDHAGLLHLSTCFVAGGRDGRIPEDIEDNYSPKGVPGFNAADERVRLDELIAEVTARSDSDAVTAELQKEIADRHLESPPQGRQLERLLTRRRAKWLRSELARVGTQRSQELGWPNTYTFTKSLAESLIKHTASDLPVTVIRPAIVETSLRTPFPGWNEGVNTSAPLSWLLGTSFRQLPVNERKCLDVVPVDTVCRGMTLITAAVLQRRHQLVYQLGTSGIKPLTMRRAIELTCLAHRKHYRTQKGFKPWLRSQFDTIPVSKRRYERFSAPQQKALIQRLSRLASHFTFRTPCLERTETDLIRIEKIVELYEPFILHNEQIFEADNVRLLTAALPPEEASAFGYDAGSTDWWHYWINVHIPALRRWSFPLIEGHLPEGLKPKRSIHLNGNGAVANGAAPGASETACTPS